MSVVLFGATDLSLAVAQELRELGLGPAGVVFGGRHPGISYAPAGLDNVRYADLEQWAEHEAIPALEWSDTRTVRPFVAALGAKVGLAAGWFHMLSGEIRDLFPAGCLGVHASLLPALRGGAPLNWAILTDATETGVTLFELGEGVDDGPIVGQRSFPIAPRATIADLLPLAESATIQLIRECLQPVVDGTAARSPQTGTPTYGLQRTPADGEIQWVATAEEVDRLVRAVGRPYPGAFTHLGNRVVRIWATEPIRDTQVWGAPGQIWRDITGMPCVVTGRGVLRITDATDAGGESLLSWLSTQGNRRFSSERVAT